MIWPQLNKLHSLLSPLLTHHTVYFFLHCVLDMYSINSLCLCVCVCVCVCVCESVFTCVYTNLTGAPTWFVCIFACIFVWMCVQVKVYMTDTPVCSASRRHHCSGLGRRRHASHHARSGPDQWQNDTCPNRTGSAPQHLSSLQLRHRISSKSMSWHPCWRLNCQFSFLTFVYILFFFTMDIVCFWALQCKLSKCFTPQNNHIVHFTELLTVSLLAFFFHCYLVYLKGW